MQTAPMAQRERLFTVRMTEEEYARVQRVAEHYGIASTALVRMLVKREADAIGLPSATPAASPTKAKKAKPSR